MSDNPARRPARENIEKNKGPGERSVEDQIELHPVIEHLIIQGMTDTQIAKEVGIDRKAVANLRKTARATELHPISGQVRRGAESARVDAEILRLAGMGMSYLDIAQEVNLSYQTVRARMTRQYKEYLADQREIAGARQTADIEMMRNELLEIIIRDNSGEVDQDMIMQALESGDFQSLGKKMSDKAKGELESKFKAMEILIKLMDRESKTFGLDAAANINVNHNIILPETIGLLNDLKQREIGNVVEAEIIEDFDLGGDDV